MRCRKRPSPGGPISVWAGRPRHAIAGPGDFNGPVSPHAPTFEDLNPANAQQAWGKTPSFWGYAFEPVFIISGSPKLCGEGQYLRSESSYPAPPQGCQKGLVPAEGIYSEEVDKRCVIYPARKGPTFDLDGDGVAETTLDSKAKCTAQSGEWSGGTCWLYAKDRWVMDGYTKPYSYKVHGPNTISWYDTPGMQLIAGGHVEHEFISYVRGTDGTFCYSKFQVTVDMTKQTETLKLISTGRKKAALPFADPKKKN